MKTIEKITKRIIKFLKKPQVEVLHFVEFLLSKSGATEEEGGFKFQVQQKI